MSLIGGKYTDLALAGAVLGGAAAIGFGVYKVVKSARENPDALNPASDENLVYKGVNNVGAILTGNQDFSLGSWIYDITHDEEF